MLSGEAILDYTPEQPAVNDKLVDDKKFREQQRKEKEIQQKVMDRDDKEANKSFSAKLTEKLAPEPVKPTTALAKRLGEEKKSSMKRRLLIHADEDSDEDGESYTNPVAL